MFLQRPRAFHVLTLTLYSLLFPILLFYFALFSLSCPSSGLDLETLSSVHFHPLALQPFLADESPLGFGPDSALTWLDPLQPPHPSVSRTEQPWAALQVQRTFTSP